MSVVNKITGTYRNPAVGSTMEQPDQIRVEPINDYDSFVSIKSEWNSLVETLDESHPFLRHEWFDAAYNWKKDQACSLCMLLLYRESELIGVCPTILSSSNYRFLKFRKLEFLTVPDTQFCSVITNPLNNDLVASAVAKWIRQHADDWTILELGYVKTDDNAVDSIKTRLLDYGIDVYTAPHGENPYIDLSSTWEQFYGGRSRRLKKGNNLVANKLARAGSLRLEWMHGSRLQERDLHDCLEAVVKLSAKSWKQVTGFSLDQDGPGRFIKSLSRSMNESQSLSVWLLYLNDNPIAMEYQLIHNGDVFALRSDYDGSFEHLSPGTYLNWKVIESLFESGFNRYFMGPGDNPYKRRWTDTGTPLAKVFGYSISWKGRLAEVLFRVILPLARRIRQPFGVDQHGEHGS